MKQTRRNLLRTTALVPLVVVGGCSQLSSLFGTSPTTSTTSVVPGWLTDLQNLVSGLSLFQGALPTSVQSVLGVLSGLLPQISSAVSSGGSVLGPLLTNFSSNFNTILSAFGATMPTGTLGQLLQAGITILPMILQLAGVVAAQHFAIVAVPMSYAQASTVLAIIAAHR